MNGGRVMVVAAVMMASGCAAQRSAQELNRLKSNVSLLDQRVSQLERASLTQPASSTAEWPSAAQPQTPAGISVAGAPVTVSPGSSAAILKPSTREIQQALKNAGFYQGSVDGKLGPKTREAIREFQRVHQLKVDGLVGKQTWEKLAPYTNGSAASGELHAAESLK